MRTSLIVAASLGIMLIGMLGSAVILLDEERVKGLVISQIERNTGRRIEILGSIDLRLFPGVRLQADQIVMRDDHDPAGPAFLAADRLDMQLRLLPLIRGRAVADEIRLSGTHLNLRIENGDFHSDVQEGTEAEAGPGLAMVPGNIILDDLSVDILDPSANSRQSFSVEQVQLTGFALDRPVAFRFNGNLGEPPLFDQLEVNGRLITRSSGQFQLNDMRLIGSLEQGRYALEIHGDLAFQAGSRSAFTLAGGQLYLNQFQLDIDLSYQALERPYLSALVSGQLLDIDNLILLDQVAMLPHEPSRQTALAAASGLDFDVHLDLAQVGQQGLVIQDLSAEIGGRQGRVSVSPLRAAIPGGLINAQATLDLSLPAPRWQLQADLALAEAGHLFTALWPAAELSGAGQLELDIESVGRTQGSGQTPWDGFGRLALWDGRFGLLTVLNDGHGDNEAEKRSFISLEAAWRLRPEALDWQSLQVTGNGWLADGEIELVGREGLLVGSLQLSDESGTVRLFELGGQLAQPELLGPPVVVTSPP